MEQFRWKYRDIQASCPVIRMKGRDSGVTSGLQWLERTSRRSRAVWTTLECLVNWRVGEDVPVGGGQKEWLVWGWATGHTTLATVWEDYSGQRTYFTFIFGYVLVKIQTSCPPLEQRGVWYGLTWILHLRAFSASGNGEISPKILDYLPLWK